jgi:probable H4MPT-linked C1 transfer pathway protein
MLIVFLTLSFQARNCFFQKRVITVKKKMEGILGWDIGGAHLKVAMMDASGKISAVIQQPCPLWKGLNELGCAIDVVMKAVPEKPSLNAVTMTGELVDLFPSRERGVAAIVDYIVDHLGCENITLFAGSKGFVAPGKLSQDTVNNIASANWLASATVVAKRIKTGLFIDIGSTTTDIIVCQGSTVRMRGTSDFERLVNAEMVYSGIIRTPVMSISQEVDFNGCRVGLMAEYFATMADVYRLTGELNESYDQIAAADGGDKTEAGSGRRLARMIGCDYQSNEHGQWQRLAENIRSRQLARLQKACENQLSRGLIDSNDCFVGAGIGRFLVKELARRLDFSYIDFEDLFESSEIESEIGIADCAPAVAVSDLARLSLN